MELFIETLTGTSFELHVSPAETIISVKSKIQKAEGIPITQQHLIWQNDELDDHRRLRDYSISGGSTLRLVLGLRGGPLNAHRIPPLRLTPIQFTQPDSSIFGSNSITARKLAHLLPSAVTSRLLFPNLPALTCSSDSSKTKSKLNLASPEDNKTTLKNHLGTSVVAGISNLESSLNNSNSDLSNPIANSLPPVTHSNSIHRVSLAISELSEEVIAIPKTSSRVEEHKESENKLNETIHANVTVISNKVKGADKPCGLPNASDDANYPPLFPSFDSCQKIPNLLNRCEFSSYWKVCGPRDCPSHSSLSIPGALKDSLCESTEEDSDNSTVLATKPKCTGDSAPKSCDKLENIGNSASTDAALLAGMFTSTVCHQTNGTERHFGRVHYPYHWLKKSSPSLEDEFPQPFVSPGFFDIDEAEDDYDAIAANIFDADLDKANEEEAVEEDFETMDVKTVYPCDLDDDDSLADLEDYLFYYHTGDLLFGPPSISGRSPSSFSYYSIRDPYGLDQWRAGVGLSEETNNPATVSTDASPSAPSQTPWHTEYNQLAEKVKNLKTKMKNLRSRKQRQQHQTSIYHEHGNEQLPPSLLLDVQKYDLNTKNGVSNSTDVSFMSCDAFRRVDQTGPPSTIASESIFTNIPRQRRFGTIVPPDLSFFIEAKNDTDTTNCTPEHSVNRCSRVIKSDTLNAPNNELPHSKSLGRSPPEHFPLINGTATLSISGLSDIESAGNTSVAFVSVLPTVNTADGNKSPVVQSKQPELTLIASPCKPPIYANLPNPRSPVLQFLPSIPNYTSPNLVNVSSPASRSRSNVEPYLQSSVRPSSTNGGHNVVPNISQAESLRSPKLNVSPTNAGRRRRCTFCLRKIGLVNTYSCRCGRLFCSRHRYAEVHACPFDYKAEARRYLTESNPVVTAPKLPKI